MASALGCSLGEAELSRDRQVLAAVESLVGGADSVAERARRGLVKVGPRAIPLIETGLYGAEADGRLRIVRTLAGIGHADAVPILQHLATHDPDRLVREAASQSLAKLGFPKSAASATP